MTRVGQQRHRKKKVEKAVLKNTEASSIRLHQLLPVRLSRTVHHMEPYMIYAYVYFRGPKIEPIYSNMHTEAFINKCEGAAQN